jgi:hypothetical protein
VIIPQFHLKVHNLILLASDGVSEGEFAIVEEIELGGMKGKSCLIFHVKTDFPSAMLQEMNTDIAITFVVVTKRQCVFFLLFSRPPFETETFSAMSNSSRLALVTETGQVIRRLEPLSTPQS